jgi:hypothetical protein
MWDYYPQMRPRLKLRISVWVVVGVIVLTVLGVDVPAPPTPAEVRVFVAQLGTPDAHAKPKPKAKRSRRRPVGSVPGIPTRMLGPYVRTGAGERWCTPTACYQAWAVLAGIGKIESDHGRSSAPGVRSGVNRHGCCAGPMQFNLTDGPPSTWDTFGRGNVYDPADAVAAAGRKLRAQGARRALDRALHAYNHDWGYVASVKALARRYQRRS